LARNHLYLIEGDPGTGKTTIAMQFLMEGTRLGQKGLYVTLSESKTELLEIAESHGWSLDGIDVFELAADEKQVNPEVQYTVFNPSEIELADTTNAVLSEVERLQPARIVFDSLSELRLLARDSLRYRRQILGLKQYFSGRRCTVLLLDDRTAEGHDLQLQSIAHGVILMESVEREYGIKRRRLEVKKLRGSRFREGSMTTQSSGAAWKFIPASWPRSTFLRSSRRSSKAVSPHWTTCWAEALIAGPAHFCWDRPAAENPRSRFVMRCLRSSRAPVQRFLPSMRLWRLW
jgi:KaiC/GvpD/RAD55 family RecA-like ATPase